MDAVVGVPAVPAVIAPAITALKGWEDAIEINKTTQNIEIVAYLPYASSPLLIGASTSGVAAINEMTMPSLTPGIWKDGKASNNPDTAVSEPVTVERYFYKQALDLVGQPSSTSTIQNTSKSINGVVVPCKKITLNLVTTNYDINSESLQLGKLELMAVLT